MVIYIIYWQSPILLTAEPLTKKQMFLKWCQNLQNLNKTKYYLKAGLNENRGENKPVSILFTLIYDLFLSDVYINEFTMGKASSLKEVWYNYSAHRYAQLFNNRNK